MSESGSSEHSVKDSKTIGLLSVSSPRLITKVKVPWASLGFNISHLKLSLVPVVLLNNAPLPKVSSLKGLLLAAPPLLGAIKLLVAGSQLAALLTTLVTIHEEPPFWK